MFCYILLRIDELQELTSYGHGVYRLYIRVFNTDERTENGLMYAYYMASGTLIISKNERRPIPSFRNSNAVYSHISSLNK